MEALLQDLLKEIKYELFHYPMTSKKQDLKYFVKRLLKPAGTPKRDKFFWTHAMLASALESAGEIETLKKYYDSWIEKGVSIYNIDNVMNGYSLLYVYEQTKDEKYKKAAHRLYEYICNYRKEMNHTIPYRKHHPKHIYADGVGMISPFLCRYGAMFSKTEAIDSGAEYIQDFLKYGMDLATGLPYHGYDLETKVKYGIIGWGRAVGWLMLGIVDSLGYMPESRQKEELKEALGLLIKSSCKYLRKDGYFSWQLTAADGPKDTSATAMIGYSMQKAVQGGVCLGTQKQWTDERECKDRLERNDAGTVSKQDYGKLTEKIKQALTASCKDGKIYDCSGECEGFSQYPQIYGAYPWSLGPGVRFFLENKKGNALMYHLQHEADTKQDI